jgi:two-component system NtrC family sensor kinase
LRFLHVIEGPDEGANYALPDHEPQLIGRSTEALPSTDHEVSRRHAELTPDGGAWLLRDLESTNGTLVNGRPTEGRVRLERGDRITCGSTVLLFDESPAGDIPIRATEPAEARLEVVGRQEVSSRSKGGQQETANDHERLEVLMRATELAVSNLDMNEYLDAFMDLLLDAFPAEHVVLMIFSPGGSGASTIMARRRDESNSQPIGLNRELIRQVQEPPFSTMLATEQRSGDSEEAPRWLMGSPLNAGDRLCGVACLDCSGGSSDFVPGQEDINLFHTLTAQAGMATERGELMKELLVRGRLAAMGETVAAISHGIKNILQGLRGGADAVQLALERKDLELADRGWPIVARNLERIQTLTMNMLGFARQRALERERMPVETVILEAMEMLEALTSRSEIDIRFEPEDGVPPIPIDTAAILQILINLVSNAIDSSPRQSTVTLILSFDSASSRVRIDVLDAGSGIDPTVRERLFEPFVTTKGQRGTGLGLVVSRRIAERHGGTLECIRTGPNGTLMRLELPADDPAEEPDDTHGPRGIRESDLDLEFGAPEH